MNRSTLLVDRSGRRRREIRSISPSSHVTPLNRAPQHGNVQNPDQATSGSSLSLTRRCHLTSITTGDGSTPALPLSTDDAVANPCIAAAALCGRPEFSSCRRLEFRRCFWRARDEWHPGSASGEVKFGR